MNETLEEAAERNHNEQKLNTYTPYSFNDAFKDGAKWQQQKMYTEEEVKEFMRIYARSEGWTVNEIFEQFKKK